MTIKKAGNFLYGYQNCGKEVAVAKASVASDLSGQLEVHERLDSAIEFTGMFCVVDYNSFSYTALLFNNTISEEDLVWLLTK